MDTEELGETREATAIGTEVVSFMSIRACSGDFAQLGMAVGRLVLIVYFGQDRVQRMIH